VIARLLLVLAIAAPSVAAAQELSIPGRLDLNGLWELNEHGVVIDGPAIVRITHSGPTVYAEFVSGASCEAGGSPRPHAFYAQLKLEPTNPPTGTLSSPGMWVCSGSPEAVKKCGAGGALKPSYQAPFTNAVVDPDYIEGKRFRQGYKDCSLDSSQNSTVDFSLRRLQPCEFEEMTFKQRDNDLHTIMNDITAPALVAMRAAIDAAHRRFGDRYEGRLVDTLRYPNDQLLAAFGDSLAVEALAAALPAMVERPEWVAARVMAEEMSILPEPPLVEARRMVETMLAIQQKAAEARRAFDAFMEARAALQKCRMNQG
jgi:hypothetical protein